MAARKRAWTFQDKRQVEKHGESKAGWYVGYTDPDGNRKQESCGSGQRGKKLAQTLADKRHSELVTGTFEGNRKTTWAEFRKDFDRCVVGEMDAGSREAAKQALSQFERLSKPNLMARIRTETIDEFIRRRKREEGRISEHVSPATVNKELRYIRSALRVAFDWDRIDKVPKFRFLKVMKRLPTFVPPEHFKAIYNACDTARFPSTIRNIDPADWWRGVIVTAYMTGWRITQILSLKWDDIDLDAGTAVSLAEDNKGKRDIRIPLHPVIVDHLRKVSGSFDSHVFPWDHNRRTLWSHFHEIQESAKLDDDSAMPKAGKEGWYGFHDLRRGFATENAEDMDLFELQHLMQHRSLETTKLYVGMAKKLNKAVNGLKVPDVLRSDTA